MANQDWESTCGLLPKKEMITNDMNIDVDYAFVRTRYAVFNFFFRPLKKWKDAPWSTRIDLSNDLILVRTPWVSCVVSILNPTTGLLRKLSDRQT